MEDLIEYHNIKYRKMKSDNNSENRRAYKLAKINNRKCQFVRKNNRKKEAKEFNNVKDNDIKTWKLAKYKIFKSNSNNMGKIYHNDKMNIVSKQTSEAINNFFQDKINILRRNFL